MSPVFTLATTLALAAFCATPLIAEERAVLGIGEALPAFNLQDQHERPSPIPATTHELIFAADNAGAKLVEAVLADKDKDWLLRTGRVYLADIHRMPALISRMFALPALREKPYAIILGREAGDLAMLPRQAGCVTLLPLQDGRLAPYRYACTADELGKHLK
jgi:hypothetical protein